MNYNIEHLDFINSSAEIWINLSRRSFITLLSKNIGLYHIKKVKKTNSTFPWSDLFHL